MINEDYCSYEVAKLLKEKGFVTPCDWLYCSDGTFGHRNSLWDKEMFPAPTHQMAMKWLRKNHIILVVQPEYFNAGSECSYWGVDIWADDNYEKIQGDFPTYEQAVEAALKYCLENLI